MYCSLLVNALNNDSVYGTFNKLNKNIWRKKHPMHIFIHHLEVERKNLLYFLFKIYIAILKKKVIWLHLILYDFPSHKYKLPIFSPNIFALF